MGVWEFYTFIYLLLLFYTQRGEKDVYVSMTQLEDSFESYNAQFA